MTGLAMSVVAAVHERCCHAIRLRLPSVADYWTVRFSLLFSCCCCPLLCVEEGCTACRGSAAGQPARCPWPCPPPPPPRPCRCGADAQAHIWSIRPQLDERFPDKIERLQQEENAARARAKLPGDRLNISFQPRGPPRSAPAPDPPAASD